MVGTVQRVPDANVNATREDERATIFYLGPSSIVVIYGHTNTIEPTLQETRLCIYARVRTPSDDKTFARSTSQCSLALVGVPRVHRANLLGIAEGVRTKGKINATRPPNTQRETKSTRKPPCPVLSRGREVLQ